MRIDAAFPLRAQVRTPADLDDYDLRAGPLNFPNKRAHSATPNMSASCWFIHFAIIGRRLASPLTMVVLN
jgi:hypothetical protein